MGRGSRRPGRESVLRKDRYGADDVAEIHSEKDNSSVEEAELSRFF